MKLSLVSVVLFFSFLQFSAVAKKTPVFKATCGKNVIIVTPSRDRWYANGEKNQEILNKIPDETSCKIKKDGNDANPPNGEVSTRSGQKVIVPVY